VISALFLLLAVPIEAHGEYRGLFGAGAVPNVTLPNSGPPELPLPPKASGSSAGTPNILLITVDTLRPDALGWVSGRNATPTIDALAAEGAAFPSAVSPVPVTMPAHASIFTGLLPRHHGVRDNSQTLAEGIPTLGESLKELGYATGAVISGFPLDHRFGLNRGFDHYDDALPPSASFARERKAPQATSAALKWLSEAPEPWFLWVHYYDPHDPYAAPGSPRLQSEDVQEIRAAYDAEVRYTDLSIGKLLEGARGKESKDPGARALLTVFTADHGESLGEHGEPTHGFFVYESTLAVPLIFHMPGRIPAARHDTPVQLVDLTPTVLDFLDLKPRGKLDGQTLQPLLEGQPQVLKTAFMESQRPWASYGWSPLKAVRNGPWKLIVAPRPELYNLSTDPLESRNLIDENRPQARLLQALLREIEQDPAVQARRAGDAETVQRLEALGYVGAGGPRSDRGPSGGLRKKLADPKDKVVLWAELHEAEARLQGRDFAGALAAFDRVLREEPENRFALSRSGISLFELGRSKEAVDRLRRALSVDPSHSLSRQALALSLQRLGKPKEAAKEWREVLRLQPAFVEGWAQLALSLEAVGSKTKAREALDEGLRQIPEAPALWGRRALMRAGSGDLEGAVGDLRREAELARGAFAHNAGLGLLLLRLGKTEEALHWLTRAHAGESDYPEARLELARLAARVGNTAQARAALDDALEAQPQLQERVANDPYLSVLRR